MKKMGYSSSPSCMGSSLRCRSLLLSSCSLSQLSVPWPVKESAAPTESCHITVGEERCNDSEPDEQQPSSIVFKLAPKLLTPQAHPLLTLRAT